MYFMCITFSRCYLASQRVAAIMILLPWTLNLTFIHPYIASYGLMPTLIIWKLGSIIISLVNYLICLFIRLLHNVEVIKLMLPMPLLHVQSGWCEPWSLIA